MNTRITFLGPCQADWSAMTPNGRARHCEACGKHVHDLSRYTPEEADGFLAGPDGPACLRALVWPDGEVATLPSRTGRRLFASVAPVFVALAATAAQAHGSAGAIGGVVSGGARVTVTATRPGFHRSVAADVDGRYRLRDLPPGTYQLQFAQAGGRAWAVDSVPVRQGHMTVRDVAEPGPVVAPPMPIPTAGVPLPPPAKPEGTS